MPRPSIGDPEADKKWPASPMQRATILRTLLSPDGGFYIQQLVCDWTEALSVETWRRAWERMAARHEVLRAGFVSDADGKVTQRFVQGVGVTVSVEENVSTTRAEGVARLDEFLAADRRRGFDPAEPPLWRLSVFRWRDATTSVWTFHHALLDGRSHAIVWREANAVYRALLAGREEELAPARPYSEFIGWLESGAAAGEAAAGYWRARLAGFGVPPGLPSLVMSSESGGEDGLADAETRVIPPDETRRLKEGARRHGVTLNSLVQGAWALVLARYNGVDDVVFGSTRACRHWTAEDPDSRVGLFINTVPFRVDADPSQAVGSWLAGLRAQQIAARDGEHASADQIRAWCGLPQTTALIRSVVMFEAAEADGLAASEGQRVRLLEKIDHLTLAAYGATTLSLTVDYPRTRYPAAQIRALLGHLATVLSGLADAPSDLPLAEVPMMDAAERARVLDSWQGAPWTSPVPPLHRVLEARAAERGPAPAVEFLDEAISHAELHVRANRLARRLLGFGGPGNRVCVVLDRCHDQVVAWLAALKSGWVYAPVDPSNPPERLAFHLDDLRPAVVLTQSSFLANLPAAVPVLALDSPDERAALGRLESGNLEFEPARDAPANLLYTSGSTGIPKAAINGHAGLANFAAEVRQRFDFGPTDRILQSSSTGFDASLFDFVASLQSGATLVLVPAHLLKPGPGLAPMLDEKRISVVLLTPTTMRSTSVPSAGVRWVVSAGEPLTPDLVARWAPGRRLLNVCGPTECSVWFHCGEAHADGTKPTIGRLVAGCRGYVLDESRRPVATGVPGELWLGGAGVGLGYWNRPELTAESYLADPFDSRPGARMYRTGDRVRWLADGRVEHLGRRDHQIKHHGMRVELGEIEAAVRGHPGVAGAVVAVHAGTLLCWMVPRGRPTSPTAMRAWLAGRLPLVFVPTFYEWVPEFPPTRTGKADRAALVASWLSAHPAATTLATKPSPEERHRVLHEWNATARAYPTARSVLEFFREHVARRPDAVAIEGPDGRVGYAELDRRANRVARGLLRAGVVPGGLVALRFDRSAANIVAMLGVLKAGAAFLPLDADTPAERQEWILADSGARLALVVPSSSSAFPGWSGMVIGLDAHASVFADEEPTDPGVGHDPSRRAYVIYTSGSTGRPKGVEIEHRSLANLVCHYHERLALTPADRCTLLANPSFDASVADVWPGLCAGGTLLVPEKGLLLDPDGLIAWLAASRATFSFVPTPLGEILFGRPWPAAPSLRHFCVGGDVLRRRPPAGLPFVVWNTYGPTENTVDSTWGIVEPDGTSARPTIGRPIANVRAYVLSATLDPVPPGVEGELYLGGEQVARGYLHRPALTMERFLPDPFAEITDARMYRTGDRVRWRDDGELEFLGRADDQIQIRGQRAELGEIEACLLEHPRVVAACCRPVADGEDIAGVVAHVALAEGGEGDADPTPELRGHAARRLPAFMVPSRFIRHAALPMTPQGKVDRAALDAWGAAATDTTLAMPAGNPETQPMDALEWALTELWGRVLGRAGAGAPGGTFDEHGGDSLLAVKLLLGVHEITGRRLALSTFLLDPTLSGLCRVVTAAEHESQRPVLTMRKGGGGCPVFCVYDVSGDVGGYFELADKLRDRHAVHGIRSPALHDPTRLPDSIEAAARQARQWLREVHRSGPFALVGYSWGGLLAFEMARQTLAEEGFAPFCALLGTSSPPRDPSTWLRLVHAARWLPHWAWEFARDRGHRRERLLRAVPFLKRFGKNVAVGEALEVPAWMSTALPRHHVELLHRYRPVVPRPVPIHLFRERGSYVPKSHPAFFRFSDHEKDAGWSRWIGCRARVHWLDGHHLKVRHAPQVAGLAAALLAALDETDSSSGGTGA